MIHSHLTFHSLSAHLLVQVGWLTILFAMLVLLEHWAAKAGNRENIVSLQAPTTRPNCRAGASQPSRSLSPAYSLHNMGTEFIASLPTSVCITYRPRARATQAGYQSRKNIHRDVPFLPVRCRRWRLIQVGSRAGLAATVLEG